jgi:hypothetical protein
MTENTRVTGRASLVLLVLLIVVAAGGFLAFKRLGQKNGAAAAPTVVRKKAPQPSALTGAAANRPLVVHKKMPSPSPEPNPPPPAEEPSPIKTPVASEDAAVTSRKPVEAPEAVTAAAEPAAVEIRSPAVTEETRPSAAAEGALPSPVVVETAAEKKAPTSIAGRSTELPEKPGRPHPYSILVSSCRKRESVEHVISKFRRLGLEPYFVGVELNPGEYWWRVFVGHYRNSEEADQIKKDLGLEDAIVKKTPYANLIEVFTKRSEASNLVQAIRQQDFSPYLLQYTPDRYGLVVGAFETRQAARQQERRLADRGIPNRVIER